MSDPLLIYIRDHLAGAKAALDLLGALQTEHAGKEFGDFCADLLIEIEADQGTLKDLAARLGDESISFKETVAWLASKVSQFKVGRHAAGDLGVLEALEILTLGIHGKLALWRALEACSAENEALRGLDYSLLIDRARSQQSQTEARRLEAARAALRPSTARS